MVRTHVSPATEGSPCEGGAFPHFVIPECRHTGTFTDRPAVVTVVIVRHPDTATQYSAFAPNGVEVRFVEADLGSSFDGKPTDAEEAEVAIEIAQTLEDGVKELPAHSETRSLALSWAESLRDDAAEFIVRD